ncbi:zinc-binding alcohol dehydrogenase family protein [Pseudidiomarina gelatinasegens]|uniref:Zinc-type alcohol dehydrogenase-like protein n=1 Tax=Pseudidiomarina gelatinasegens TaxID=2487740 RepID=A0A443Z6N5_9GAMM|nr:zinc-binding alcohol dehydrogenase family protein [Pseudidiomarina gelatinasegens]RWU12404.1 zinc-binding alcohol dehydrogenase family protein [Pseudidiomarina gelatinasegens]
MKAVGYEHCGTIDAKNALVDAVVPDPEIGPNDILVAVYGIGVNPVDTKIRSRREPSSGQLAILGWDASGTVLSVGENVFDFKEGDDVWYAGALTRQGSNAQYQVVDARIVSKKPQTLNFAEAAAMPLTFLTAWELLFDRFRLDRDSSATLLITGAAGGVGSAMLQLTKLCNNITAIATASRAESQQWATDMGADIVIDHTQPLADQLRKHGIEQVTHVASLTHTDQHFAALVELLAPQGHFALIDDPEQPLDIKLMKQKSLALHWEFMFTRSLFETPDMHRQGQILHEVAELTDAGKLVTTMTSHFGELNAENLLRAHRQLESHSTIGKIVLDGYNLPYD